MVTVFSETMTKAQVVASPKDEVLSGVITTIEKGLLSEFLDERVHSKFDNLEQPTLRIGFEVSFGDKTIKGNDRLAFYDEPMANSKLGKFLEKYGELKAGQEIKVLYDGDGFGKIKVD